VFAATVVVASSLVGVILGGVSATASSTVGPRELVYVANADSGPVTAYPSTAHGPTPPVATLPDPKVGGTVWDPWDVAVGPSSSLFVQTFVSDATTFVFARPASKPSRIFRVQGPDSEGLAVDAAGYEYVMGGEGAPAISVVAPEAAGLPGDLYSVNPVRQLETDQDGFSPWPSVLTVDSANKLLAAVTHRTGNAIEVFQGGPSGPATPIRMIVGPQTGLGTCSGFDTCDHVSITFSPYTGRIYAAVSSPSGSRIEVFAGNASGDARPVRTIAGSSTGLSGNVMTGIADSQHTGDIYVLVKSAQFQGPAQVEAFARLAAGNVAPLRSFTDAASGLADAEGIAITG
jgi:hypothetical protein